MNSHSARSVHLRLEELEIREVPSSSGSLQTFETTPSHTLPAGWVQWSSNKSSSFEVLNGSGFGSNNGLSTTAGSNVSARTWMTSTAGSDVQVQADVLLNSSVPIELFARGWNLDSSRPTYYAVSITRGTEVNFLKVVGGQTTVLATVDSIGWVSNEWLRVKLTAQGDHLTVSVFRINTAQYMTQDGFWQSAPANAVDLHDGKISGTGHVGLARPAQNNGTVSVDNFAVSTPSISASSTAIHEENFGSTPSGDLPAGWGSYTNTRGQSFQVNSATASVSGDSGLVARSWYDTQLPADVQVSASMYIDSFVPAQIYARGQNLSTDQPDYYAVSLTRGATVQLLRVVDGRTTVLGSVTSGNWLSKQWVQATLSISGTTLRVQLYRTDTGQYLTANGAWQVSPTWAIEKTDQAIRGPGKAGIGRASGSSGAVSFQNFFVTSAPSSSGSSGSGQTGPGNSRQFGFNSDAIGSLPSGWSSWTRTDRGGFRVTAQPALSNSNGLASTGGSEVAARAWFNGQTYGDVQVTGSIFVNGLTPAQLFTRGKNLSSGQPSYYAVSISRGLHVELTRVNYGKSTVLASANAQGYQSGSWFTVSLSTVANTLEVVVYRADTRQYLNSNGQWQSKAVVALSAMDGSIPSAGYVGVDRPSSYDGRVFLDNISLVDLSESNPARPPDDSSNPPVSQPPTTSGSGSTSPPISQPPGSGGSSAGSGVQHYSHIRVAELAYYGTPIGDFEQNLLKNSVDLVVANPIYLDQIQAKSPNTSKLIYSNVSNIYLDLFTDWLAYADRNGQSRESAFYHVNQATAFSGDSSSSRPVNQFWSVQRGSTSSGWTDFTNSAHQNAQNFGFGNAGDAVAIGYPEKFREINISLSQGASSGWSGVLEYASTVNASGTPTGWTTLRTLSDTTNGLHNSGTILFDPPGDWKTSTIGGSDHLFFVRVRTTHGGVAPVAQTILGRDYVNAKGGSSGVIPAFDSSADRDGDGYLNDQEYASRRPGMNARFEYESRLFYPSYGQMRFATNPSNSVFRAWAADYSNRFLNVYSKANGLFIDNSSGRLQVDQSTLKESLSTYAADYGSLLASINTKIGPRWVLANTAGGNSSVDPIVKNQVAYLEEFALRPMASTTSQFEDTAALVSTRMALSNGKGDAILDTYSLGGAPDDARTQIASLAYYYLIADPKHTFVLFNGGLEPATTWSRHWTDAVKYNVGQPQGSWSVFTSGRDPEDHALTYKVYERKYENALVLYKPLSYAQGVGGGTLDDATATTHYLNGNYRLLRADGSLGSVISQVTLRNGEGAILIKA